MRQYSSMHGHAFLLEGLDELPSEIEQCLQRIRDLENALKSDLDERESLLKRHVACLKVLNGDQGARFAESLVSAVSRSDRCAQEICYLREHISKVEALREGHWRAAASVSLSKLNSSYLKAKEQFHVQAKELTKLRQERDDAVIARIAALAELADRQSRTQSLTLPASVCASSTLVTPETSTFNLSTFPMPPQTSHLDEARQVLGIPLPPTASTSETKTRMGRSTNNLHALPADSPRSPEKPDGTSSNCSKPLPLQTPFCSLPTRAITEDDLTGCSRSTSPATPSNPDSRFRDLKDRFLSSPKAKRGSTTLSDSGLPWARLTSPPPSFLLSCGRSRSAPGCLGHGVLDPQADQSSSEVETLRSVPCELDLSKALPTDVQADLKVAFLHVPGTFDGESVTRRGSVAEGRPRSYAKEDARQYLRASTLQLDKLEITSLLTELGGSSQYFSYSPYIDSALSAYSIQ